ncbi:MAG: hypothetical protein JHC41_07385 [Nitrosopumilus sp.]|nr:hypothetical protein [Nitrosopumilus sp.]
MKISEFKKSSILLSIFGFVLTLIGITIFWNPQDTTTNIIFLSMVGIGLFMSGLGLSILNQIRKATIRS